MMNYSQKIFVALVAFFTILNVQAQDDDPVLMTINNTDNVTLSEFEYIFKKNNPDTSNVSQEELDEYLELFMNFKLKVKEATELKMDTNPKFINELAGYRKQLAQPYLVDRKLTEQLITEGYERMKYDVRAKHILVKFANPNPQPKDTIIAYNLIKELAKKSEKQDFDQLMKTYNGKKLANLEYIAEDLGYFTAFMMVYDFENAAYNTKVGDVSGIIKTRFGYHLMKVYDKRPARGEIQAAHIMVASKDNDPQAEAKKAKINELYQKLEGGDDFGQLAKQFSDDKGSARNNGQLPWFGPGRMVQEFEDAAFGIGQNGEYSAPIKTQYGWHIIKRLSKKELGSLEEMRAEIKNKIARDGRGMRSKNALLTQIKKEYGCQPNMDNVNELAKRVDDNYKTGKWNVKAADGLNKEVFSLSADQFNQQKIYTQQDFAKYLLISQRRYGNLEKSDFINKAFQEFVDKECIAFENELLESKYPEFRSLMNEYRDGILLFDLMDKKVWNKAVKDTAGLKVFYEGHKTNYMWDTRCDASIFYCANEVVAEQAKKLAKKQVKKGLTDAYIMEQLNADSQLNLKIISDKFLKGDNPIIDNSNWIKGLSDVQDIDGQLVFVNIKSVMDPMPKKLSEAKGIITADYQKYLEDEWLKELRAKYPIEVNKSVLAEIK